MAHIVICRQGCANGLIYIQVGPTSRVKRVLFTLCHFWSIYPKPLCRQIFWRNQWCSLYGFKVFRTCTLL